MKYTFLDEHGLQTAWEIIKLYFRSLSQTLTKNNIIDLKNIDDSNSNSGGLISLELSDKLASIEEGALVNYLIKVNNTTTPATEEGIVNITIPTSISALDNDSEYLTEEDVTLLISDLLEGPTLLSDWAETNDLLITFIKNKPEIPSKVSDLLNDSNFVSKDYVDSADTTLTARIRAEEDFRMAADNNLVAADSALSGRISDIEEILPSGGSSTNTLTTMNWVRNKINAAVESKADKSEAIGSLSLAINSTNFLITLSGTKVDGTSFTVQDVIDLPLESVVVSGSYDDTTKKVILTLQNGSVIDFSVADLVAGLQSEINSSNKLSSDLVDDTNCTHKFVTTLEKSQWNNKYDKPSGGIPKTDLDSSVQTSLGKADTALQEEVDPIFNASPASEITSLDITDWNAKYDKPSGGIPSTDLSQAVQDSLSAADSAYLKPSSGIPSTDMTQAVLNSLAAADTAVQPGDLANVATSGDYDDLLNKPDLSVYAESSDLATVATSGSYNDLTNKPDLSVYAETNDLATVATTGSYEDLLNKPTIPTIPNLSKGTTTGNGNAVTDISVSGHTITLTKGTTFLTEHLDISGKANKTDAIGSLTLSMDSSTYVITLSGTKADGTTAITSQTIDLPLETVVVGGSYNSSTKKVILTLKNNLTVEFSVADLIDGLQSTIDSSHKLSADLVDDSNTINKFVTTLDKTNWNKQADWNLTTTSAIDFIKNKPDITVDGNDDMLINGHSISINGNGSAASINLISDEGIGLNATYLTLTGSGGNINFNAGEDEDQLLIHGNEGVFIEGSNNKNIKLTTSGNGKAYYNNKEIAVKDDITVTSVNGQTGAVTIDPGVTSFNGATGAITYTAPVTSVNGLTGVVTVEPNTFVVTFSSDENDNITCDHTIGEIALAHYLSKVVIGKIEQFVLLLTSCVTNENHLEFTGYHGTSEKDLNLISLVGDIQNNADVWELLLNEESPLIPIGPDVLIVAFEMSGETITCDTTIDEIFNAIESKKYVFGIFPVFGYWIMTPSFYSENSVIFSTILHADSNNVQMCSLQGATNNNTDTWQFVSEDITTSLANVIESISVNGVNQSITDKNVNITIPVTSVNNKTGNVVLNSDDVRAVRDYSKEYLTFEALENTTFTFTQNALQYSIDDGQTWSTLAANTASPTVTAGNKILWKQTGLTPTSSNGIGTFSATGNFNVSGNIMSLHYGDNFIGQTDLTGKNYAFYSLFYQNTKLINSLNLILPATILSNSCYRSMFYGCTSLVTAPEILPATSLTEYGYKSMFYGCTSLTTAPKLPATTLATYCYQYMFYNCISLTTAPELSATTLAEGCYQYMLQKCASLNYIKCLTTNISIRLCVNYWVKDVSSSGTFIKADSMTSWPSGQHGIPTGWNAYTESEWKEVRHYELADISFSGNYNDLNNLPTLGTAASKDVPSSGNASTNEVVLGNDSRLTDARTPTSHSHGKLNNSGLVGFTESDASISNGDKLIIGDLIQVSNLPAWLLNKSNIQFDGSTVNKALTPKGTWESFATLDNNGKVSSTQLPSYVDDVIEGYYNNGNFYSTYSNSTYSDLITGETGKIYVDLGNGNKSYRWSGSAYVEIVASPGTTDNIVEGSNNLFFTATRALEALSSSLNGKVSKVSSTDNAVVRFDGTSGDIQNSGVTIDDSNRLNSFLNIEKGNSNNANVFITNKSASTDYGEIFVSNADKSHTTRPLVLLNGYGNVGIGVSLPSSKLEVSGSIKASTNVTAAKFITNGGTSSLLVRGDGTLLNISTLAPYEANLLWGGKNFSASYGPLDAAMISSLGANRSAGLPASCIDIEYSRDGGTTWLDYEATDDQKRKLFADARSDTSTFYIGKSSTSNVADANCLLKVRVKDTPGKLYTTLNKFVIFVGTYGSNGCYCTIRARTKGNQNENIDTWTTFSENVPISGWTAYNIINTSGLTTCGATSNTSLYNQIEFIFGCTSHTSTTYAGLGISRIAMFGGVGWSVPSNLAYNGHLYTWNNTLDATFPASITATSFKKSGGTSSQFLKADGSVDSNTYINTGTILKTTDSGYEGGWEHAGDNAIPTVAVVRNKLIQKSSTSGLVKNDGTIDTNTYLTSISAGDNVIVSGNEVSVPTFPVNKVVPIYEKTYENYTCSAASDNDKIIYFGNVIPTSSNYYDSWEIYYTLDLHTSNDYCQGQYDVRISLGGSNLVYAVYNRFGSDSYLPIYYHLILRYNSTTLYANRETYPVKVGMRILSAYLPTSLARTYTIKVWDVRNCTFSFNNTFETHTSIYNSSYYGSISTLSATSRGLLETGDSTDTTTMQLYYSRVKAGTNGIKLYSLIMQDANGTWQSFTTGTGGLATTKLKNPVGFVLGSSIYYVSQSSDIASGSVTSHGTVKVLSSIVDLRYSFNINTTANGMPGNLLPRLPVYIVGHLGNDGLFYLEDTWWTQYEPTTEDGKIYIKVGESVYADYENARCYRADLLSDGYAYWYKNGAFRRFYGKESLNSYSISDLEFVYRKTADGITLYNGNKAVINNIKGKTLAWNLLNNTGTELHKTWTSSTSYYQQLLDSNNLLASVNEYLVNSHIYYVSADISGHITNNRKISILVGGAGTGTAQATLTYADTAGTVTDFSGKATGVKTYSLQNINKNIFINNYDSGTGAGKSSFESGDNVVVNNLMCIDLTLIYGAGNEPSTPAQFEADYFRWFGKPLTYEPYDAGSLRNVQMQGLKTTGFNQWDERTEEGGLNSTTGAETTSSSYFRSSFIRVFPNTYYRIKGASVASSTHIRPFYYTEKKEFISTGAYVSNGDVQTPVSCSFLRFIVAKSAYGSDTYNNDICINISDTNKNGTYEPYEEHNVSVPVTTLTGKVNGQGESVVIFPDGMRGVNDVKDEIKVENGVTKAIKRIGRVDLGSLDWSYYSASQIFISNSGVNNGSNTIRLCARYASVSPYNHDKVIALEQNGKTRISDASFGTNATTFKTSLSGVYLDYELAEPVEYVVDDLALPISYTVSKEGTEEITPVTGEITVAPTLDITYGVNVSDIKGLPKVSSSDNGKTLQVVNGLWALVSVPSIYTGIGVPSDLDGNDGDIYIQTF